MKVADDGKYRVYVYSELNAPHHLAHCDVRWAGHNVSVSLATLSVLAGADLPKEAKALVLEHIDAIWEEWHRLNPRLESTKKRTKKRLIPQRATKARLKKKDIKK
jgi:hypothetical protein